MKYQHGSFSAAIARKAWTRPVLKQIDLTRAELNELRAAPEKLRSFGLRLKVEGRL